jgi:hypothetical protein
LRVSVGGKVGYGLDADALDNGYEESQAVEESQGNLIDLSVPVRTICETDIVETNLAAFVELQALEDGERHNYDQHIPG